MKFNVIYILISLMILTGTAAAAPSLASFVNDDSDDIMDLGTTYAFNVTVSGVSNESTDNITACSINGVSMTSPGGNGTGVWEVNTTLDALAVDMADNCTYTTLTVTCTQVNTSEITTTNSSWTALPCLESNSGIVSASTGTGGTGTNLDATITDFTTLDSTSNQTPTLTASRAYCAVNCSTEDGDFVVWMRSVTYNTTHKYCPFDCMDVSSTRVKVQQAGYLEQVKPKQPWDAAGAAYTIIVFGLGAGAAAVISRSRRHKTG